MNKRLQLLSEERISRIIQKSGLNFTEKPPEDLVNAVWDCAKTWNRDRTLRHRPDGLIYHYCDAAALLNILKHRKVSTAVGFQARGAE